MKIVSGGKVSELIGNTPIPKMFHAKQSFPREFIAPEDVGAAVLKEIEQERFASAVKPGMEIAITAGSRGIHNIGVILKTVVDFIKSRGAKPFIVPAMGSHGGATAEGQVEVLSSYGITSEAMGCPIKSSMEVVKLGTSELGRDVYIDKNAYEADGIIPVNRIKPHTSFRGPYESGICKMLTVGLGKQAGASLVHSDGFENMGKNVPTMAKVVLEHAKVLFAVACIENAYDETYRIIGISAGDILRVEPQLLKVAFANMPNLIVGEADVLVVDEIGKNYSGTGVDPNIAGTFYTPGMSGGLKVKRTCFLNLSKDSHGNAHGCGLATAITEKLFNAIEPDKMYPNCLTTGAPVADYIPCVMANDKEAIKFCLKTCGKPKGTNARVVRIANSLNIDEIMLSESYYEDVKSGKYPGVEALDAPAELSFDASGNLVTPVNTEEK